VATALQRDSLIMVYWGLRITCHQVRMSTFDPPAITLQAVRSIGPGLITGAADDDPSGIATYSQAGAAFGLGMLWTVVLTFPLMAAVQMISARIGHVTGAGLTANIRRVFPAWFTLAIAGLLVTANTLNIAADIAAMGEALQLLIGGNDGLYAVGFGIVSLVLQVFVSYRSYVRWLKWLTLSLFTYVAVVCSLHIQWDHVALSTIWPHLTLDHAALLMIVGVFGTTISPYLFFWQAGQEVEDRTGFESPVETARQLRRIKLDTVIGMAFSNLVAFFIILCAAVTLHDAGITDIQTSAQAAEALRPLAGRFTFLLFTLGIIGTGLLAVPILAGSAAYAAAEALGLRGSLAFRLERGEGRGFYAIIALATLGGVALSFTPSSAVAELFWAAVLNGLIAVPIMMVMMWVASREQVMGAYCIRGSLRLLGWLSTALMTAAAAGLLLSF
jgi:NRAMP (natural resistance-associated macrophage protein)-like metal ion transporter